MRYQKVGVRVDPDVWKAVKRHADKYGLKLQFIVNKALAQFVEGKQ
jgi:predicted transcriptional regulator